MLAKQSNMKLKEQRGGFLSMLLGTLGASLLSDVLSEGLSGRGVIRTGEGAIRAGYGSKKSSLKNFDSYTISFNKL